MIFIDHPSVEMSVSILYSHSDREDKRRKCGMTATHFQLPAQCEMFLNLKFPGHNNVSFLKVRYCTLLLISFLRPNSGPVITVKADDPERTARNTGTYLKWDLIK